VHRYHVERLAQVLAEVDEPRREALAGAVTELVDRLQDASRAVVDPPLAAGAPADRNTA
jgi:hypothetical protein